MTLPETESLTTTITTRLLAIPNVVAVYPRRNLPTSVVGGLVALATRTAPKAEVFVSDDDGTVSVDATIGITDREPARDVGQQAYDVISDTLDDFAVLERHVVVRIATVD